jgi:hypothetical protein
VSAIYATVPSSVKTGELLAVIRIMGGDNGAAPANPAFLPIASPQGHVQQGPMRRPGKPPNSARPHLCAPRILMSRDVGDGSQRRRFMWWSLIRSSGPPPFMRWWSCCRPGERKIGEYGAGGMARRVVWHPLGGGRR